MPLLAINLALAGFMTGVIWFVQIVHYPLMHEVLEPAFRGYENEHVRKARHFLGPIMALELAASIALVALRPVWIAPAIAWGLLLLLLLIWASTFLIQGPCHKTLLNGFKPSTHSRLVTTNWIRTALWSLRTVILTATTIEAMVA
ncbi:MAG: hypothetical protein D6781_12835 [Verrucomicrobia bacterium]|nr:MAG: hypothetical protein D6781_12835 [Verrucomicrobiota bacterium]